LPPDADGAGSDHYGEPSLTARGSSLFEGSGEEDAVRIVTIVAERRTIDKPEALVQIASGRESRRRASLEADAPVGTSTGLAEDMLQHRTCDPFAAVPGDGTHGFHFAVRCAHLFQRAAPEQLLPIPNRSERNLRPEESREIERMDAFRRRKPMHALQVLGEECPDFGTGKIVDADLHDRWASAAV